MHGLKFIPGCNASPEMIRANMTANVARDLPWLQIEAEKGCPLAIVAGGPSLKYRVDELWGVQASGCKILALNGAMNYLLKRNIVPDYFMLLDARPENIDFFSAEHPSGIKHYLAAQCDPDIFSYLVERERDVTLYLTTHPDILEITKDINRTKVQVGGIVGTVGIKALSLAYALGFRQLHLYGYDSSYEDNQHHAFPQKLNDDANVIDVSIFPSGKVYRTTPTLAHQVSEFCLFSKELIQLGCEIQLHCSGLLPDMVAYENTRGRIPIEVRERAKYEEMWKLPCYSKEAPGEHLVSKAIADLGMVPGESVLDFGAGTGRAAMGFHKAQMDVTAIDFVPAAFQFHKEVKFVNACLWDLPALRGDWSFCTDVMEHIPSEKIKDVLEGIEARTRKGAVFQISTTEDLLGLNIGRRLHMSVYTPEVWLNAMKIVWKNCEIHMEVAEFSVLFVIKRKEYVS